MSKFQVSANGQVFGIYEGETEQDARNACAVDAGYESEADMVGRLGSASELEAVQASIKSVNTHGLNEIHAFLAANHKRGVEHFTPSMLRAWASEAEFQLGEGNPPTIELKSYDSIHGYAQEFTVSDAGIDSVFVDAE